MKYVVTYINEFIWPEVMGIYNDYDTAEAVIMGAIALDGKTMEDRGKSPGGPGEVSNVPFEQIRTQSDSYYSYLIHEVK
jgi:hypothetical protein